MLPDASAGDKSFAEQGLLKKKSLSRSEKLKTITGNPEPRKSVRNVEEKIANQNVELQVLNF